MYHCFYLDISKEDIRMFIDNFIWIILAIPLHLCLNYAFFLLVMFWWAFIFSEYVAASCDTNLSILYLWLLEIGTLGMWALINLSVFQMGDIIIFFIIKILSLFPVETKHNDFSLFSVMKENVQTLRCVHLSRKKGFKQRTGLKWFGEIIMWQLAVILNLSLVFLQMSLKFFLVTILNLFALICLFLEFLCVFFFIVLGFAWRVTLYSLNIHYYCQQLVQQKE